MNNSQAAIGMIKIPVTDIGRAVTYYRDVLGFIAEDVLEEYGWAHMLAGTLGLGLYVPGRGAGDRAVGGSVDFHIEVASVVDLYNRLRTRRCLMPEGVFQSDDGTNCLEIIDPDGNVLTITERHPNT